MDVVDGTESTVPIEYTVTRPSSPTPTADYSIIDENEWSYYPYHYSPSSSSLRSIIPRIWDSFSHSSDALNAPRLGRPSVPYNLSKAAKAGYGSLRGKRKARAPVRPPRPSSVCSSYYEVEWSDCTVDYSSMPPLDGEEGELIDDEGCFVDLRSVTGIDILALLPQELSLHILTFLASSPYNYDSTLSTGTSMEPDSASALHAVLACTLVSRTWHLLAYDNSVWRALFAGMRHSRGWAVDLSRARPQLLQPPLSPGDFRPLLPSSHSMSELSGMCIRGRLKSLPPIPVDHDANGLSHTRSASTPSLTARMIVPRRARPQSTGAMASPLILDWYRLFRDRWELDLRWAGKTSQGKTFSKNPPTSPSDSTDDSEPKVMRISGHTDSVYCLEFDANRIVTGSRDRTIKVWCVRTGRLLGSIRGHAGSVLCLKFDFGAQSLPSSSSDGRTHRLKQNSVWRPGFMVSGSSDCSVAVWDLFVRRMPGEEDVSSVIPEDTDDDGESMLDAASMIANVGDDDREHGDAALAEVRAVLRGHTGGVLDLRVDNQWIVSCSKDAVIRVWDRLTLEPYRTFRGHEGPVNAVGLQDGRIVSASGDGKLILWDVAAGTRVRTFEGHDRGLACIEFRGGLVASGSNDCTIKIWRADTGECIRTLVGHEALVRALAFVPQNRSSLEDGSSGSGIVGGRLVSASYDRTVRVWDVASGKMVREFRSVHTSHIFDVKFDVSKIVSTSHDQKVVVLDFAHGLDASLFI